MSTNCLNNKFKIVAVLLFFTIICNLSMFINTIQYVYNGYAYAYSFAYVIINFIFSAYEMVIFFIDLIIDFLVFNFFIWNHSTLVVYLMTFIYFIIELNKLFFFLKKKSICFSTNNKKHSVPLLITV